MSIELCHEMTSDLITPPDTPHQNWEEVGSLEVCYRKRAGQGTIFPKNQLERKFPVRSVSLRSEFADLDFKILHWSDPEQVHKEIIPGSLDV